MVPTFILNVFRDKTDGIIDKIGMSSYLFLGIFNIIYFSALFGIVFFNKQYINFFNIIVHSVLCLFLIYRFHPWRKNIEIKHYDQVIIFSSAVFLLLNLGIIEIVKRFISDGKLVLVNNTKLTI